MYQINPHQSMTDLYGVGKGEAQVFDTSIAERGLEYERRKVEADKLARQKAQQAAKDKTADMLNRHTVPVHPADVNDLIGKQNSWRNEVVDTFKKYGGNIPVEAQADLDKKWGYINNIAQQSKQRFDVEKLDLAKEGDVNYPMHPRDAKKLHEDFQTPSFNKETGAYDFSKRTNPVVQFDLEKNIIKPYSSDVVDAALKNEEYKKAGMPIEASAAHAAEIVEKGGLEGKKRLHNDILDIAEEGGFDKLKNNVYGSPKDEFGNPNLAYIPDPQKRKEIIEKTTPDNMNLVDFSIYKNTNRFIAHKTGYAPPQYGVAGDIAKPAFGFNPNTNELTATAKSAPVKVRDDFGNENIRGLMLSDVKVKLDPETGEVIGGRADVVNEKNYDRAKFYADLNRYKELVSKEGLDENGHIGKFKTKDKKYADIAIKSKDGEYTVQYKDFIKKEFPQGVPKHTDSKYGGKVFKSVELTPDQTQELFFELNKEKPQDVYREKTGGRTRLIHLEKINEEVKPKADPLGLFK